MAKMDFVWACLDALLGICRALASNLWRRIWSACRHDRCLNSNLPGCPARPMMRMLEEDHGHINSLPDDVLIEIICRLTIHDAVVTGGVSKRWRHLSKCVSSFCLNRASINLKGEDNFEDEGAWNEYTARLAGVVRSVLRHHCGVGVKDFLFALPLACCCYTVELDQVVEFAAAAGTRHLAFSLVNSHCSEHAGPPYDFPLWRFASGRLKNLILQNVGLTMPLPRNLKGLARLKYLDLSFVAVDDSGVANILSTCGALIVLYLRGCPQLIHLNMSHARLCLLDIFCCVNLKSITIQASTLTRFAYRGHKVDIKYSHTPVIMKLKILLHVVNECPLDCIGAAGDLPNLKQLFLEFPSPMHAATCTQLQGVHYCRWFGSLNRIVLLLNMPWKEHISSVAYLLVATPLVKELRIEAYGNLPTSPPNILTIQWPECCLMKKLQSIIIGGFSGEPELIELTSFLLQRSPALRTLAIDTHRWHLQHGSWAWKRVMARWKREEAEDHVRCYYARGVALTNLVPKIPSTVNFTIL